MNINSKHVKKTNYKDNQAVSPRCPPSCSAQETVDNDSSAGENTQPGRTREGHTELEELIYPKPSTVARMIIIYKRIFRGSLQ